HTGEDFLPLHCAVDSLTGSEAVVAGPAFGEWFSASTLVGFSKILEELDAAAQGALAKLDELHEVFASNHLLLLIRDIVDETVQSNGIRPTIKEHTFTRQAV